jgi:hypothetical protein
MVLPPNALTNAAMQQRQYSNTSGKSQAIFVQRSKN